LDWVAKANRSGDNLALIALAVGMVQACSA
jgi:hypothetical protein